VSVHRKLALAELRRVAVVGGRSQLTNAQLIALAQVHATLDLAEATRTRAAIAALQLGSSALDYANPDLAKGDPTRVRQRRANELRRQVREGLGIADGTGAEE
jgi:hypothetical protein